MVKIKLRIVGLPLKAGDTGEDSLDVENLKEIIQSLESKYPSEHYSLSIFLNGISVDDLSKSLSDGDEVVIVPVMSGG